MFYPNSALARRVSISHRNGSVVIRIRRNNRWKRAVFALFAVTIVCLYFSSIFLRGFFRIHSVVESFYLLPFIAFIVVWYIIGARIALWRAFGVEELTIGHGRLHWERTAWKWRRSFDGSLPDISQVKAKIPWHGLANRVEFTCEKRQWAIGDMLLQDEAKEIANELKKPAELHRHSGE